MIFPALFLFFMHANIMVFSSSVLALSLALFAVATSSIASDTQLPLHEAVPPSNASPNPPPLTYIPPMGLGLWQSPKKDVPSAVHHAFTAGYRHLDSAAAYSNEPSVGHALSHTTLPRSSYWLTSKLWNTAHAPHLVEPALRRTLSDLNTTYLDLYLMHWPIAQHPNGTHDNTTSITATWHAMEALIRQGLTRHIGISNFSPNQLTQILDHCLAGGICPIAHEFESHPYLQQQAFVDAHKPLGIQVIAYSPLGNLNPIYDSPDDLPSILEDPFWIGMAKRKNCTVPQAVLGWGIARGTVVIPKSVHESRIVENWGANAVRFEREEMEEIARTDRKVRFNNPSEGWGVKLFEGLDGV
jgi:alcohol dehydrogenase (NADP+)